jgi:hypothetical protein
MAGFFMRGRMGGMWHKPQFSLRSLLLSFLICAIIFGWLKVLDNHRRHRNELRARLAVLESERSALSLAIARWFSGEGLTKRMFDEYDLEQTNLEIKRIRGELGEPEPIEQDLVKLYRLQDRERTLEQLRNEQRIYELQHQEAATGNSSPSAH